MINSFCPVCRGNMFEIVFLARDYMSGEKFVVCRCRDCGLAITGFDDRIKNIGDYYGDQYYGNRKSLTENIINFLRIRTVFKILGSDKKSLLDIGCGNGSFLMRIKEKGWSVAGTEVAPPSHIHNGANSFIYKGDLLGNRFDDQSLDVITMWHSLEHITDPLGYMHDIARILKKGGALIVEVPNFISWQSRIFKTNWFHLDVPRHLLHFSKESLLVMLKESGFKDVKVISGSFIYQFYGWLQSILNVFSRRKNILFELINGKITPRALLFEHSIDLVLNVVLLFPVIVVSFIFSIVENLFNKNGIILIHALN